MRAPRLSCTHNGSIAEPSRAPIRMHVCWGNCEAPHDSDMPFEAIRPVIRAARVGALVLPFADPRHALEHRAFRKAPLAEDRVLVAGVIDTRTNFVEHAEVVAERLERIAESVGGAGRLMAGTDCGFDTSAGRGRVAPEVVRAKLRAMAEGTRIASDGLLRTPQGHVPALRPAPAAPDREAEAGGAGDCSRAGGPAFASQAARPGGDAGVALGMPAPRASRRWRLAWPSSGGNGARWPISGAAGWFLGAQRGPERLMWGLGGMALAVVSVFVLRRAIRRRPAWSGTRSRGSAPRFRRSGTSGSRIMISGARNPI
jgi:hypothetical protein